MLVQWQVMMFRWTEKEPKRKGAIRCPRNEGLWQTFHRFKLLYVKWQWEAIVQRKARTAVKLDINFVSSVTLSGVWLWQWNCQSFGCNMGFVLRAFIIILKTKQKKKKEKKKRKKEKKKSGSRILTKNRYYQTSGTWSSKRFRILLLPDVWYM